MRTYGVLFFIILFQTSCAESSSQLRIDGLGDITPKMWEIILTKPASIPKIKQSANLANKYSEEFCDVVGKTRRSRDEVDATRHFILSSLLASYVGKSFTREFLTAHEQRSDEYTDENIMDLRNNDIGIDFSSELETMSTNEKLDAIEIELFERLDSGELWVLDSKESACANEDEFPNM